MKGNTNLGFYLVLPPWLSPSLVFQSVYIFHKRLRKRSVVEMALEHLQVGHQGKDLGFISQQSGSSLIKLQREA